MKELFESFEALAAKWDHEAGAKIEQASIAPTWEEDAELRGSGTTARRCAKELREELSKFCNKVVA